MATIAADGSIDPHPRFLEVAGSSKRGLLFASYTRLRDAFGEEDTPAGAAPGWSLLILTRPDHEPNQRARIYFSGAARNVRRIPDKVVAWYVGGYCDLFRPDGHPSTLAMFIDSALNRLSEQPRL